MSSWSAKRKPWARAAALWAALLMVIPAAAQQQAPQRAPGTLTEGVTAVLVDVVVRDRRGQPVRDLTAADFEIFEDGVPQTLGSFTPVFNAVAPPPAAVASPAVPAPARPAAGTPEAAAQGPLVTALVFDRLSPEARQIAVKAAQDYIGGKEQTGSHVGIFAIDLSLRSYATFTRNAEVLRKALQTVGAGTSASFNSPERAEQRANADRQAAASTQAVASAAAQPGPAAGAAMGTAAGEAQLAQMASNMIQAFDAMGRDQQGYATTDGLIAIVQTLARLPGRKSLMLFSEGVAIPPAVQRLFAGVIDAANRANVSIYTLDAAGLRASSEQATTADDVNAAAKRGINTGYASGSEGGGRPLTELLERNEDVLRRNPRASLGTLAQETGGIYFENTNDLRTGVGRIEEDLRNYYLLGYTPSNTEFDGRFRRIEVKVKRPDVVVAARKGYFGVRNPGGVAISAGDAEALGALEQKPVPNAFPVRAAALLFPERGRPGLAPTVVDFSTASIAFQPSADGRSYTSDVTVLVRFLDGDRQVVRTVSQHYEISGPLAEMEGARRGEVIFYREPELSPGVYTMETVVHDALAGKSSVRFSTVEVPKPVEGALRMSSIVVVKRAEKIPEKDRRAGNPLAIADTVFHPNLGEPVSRAAKEVPFYFTLYPAAGGSPELAIELLRNGKLLARLPMSPGPPDPSGRVQQLGRLPLEQLEPGTYDLRAVARQGGQQVVRSTVLRVVE